MKKISYRKLLTLVLSFSTIFNSLFAQSRAEAFSSQTPITWLGVDFSEAKYFGDPGTVSQEQMKTMTININYLLINETEKYDFHKTFEKETIINDIKEISEINNSIDATKIMSLDMKDYTRFNPTSIQTMVSKYNFESNKGIGLVFVMEGMNKTIEEGAFWVTYINMSDKSVLFTERITGKGFGFGYRNHWAGSILNGMKDIKSNRYKKWKTGTLPKGK